MKALYHILFLLLPLLSFCQSYDSIEEEIIGARPSKYELFVKVRYLLIEALEKSDSRAVQKYGSYLLRKNTENKQLNLSDDELILLNFVSLDFNYILNNLQTNPNNNYYFKYHLTTELRNCLVVYLKANYVNVLSKIFLSNIKEEEKHFLKLYLRHLLKNNDDFYIIVDLEDEHMLDNSAKEFIEKFPKSAYVYYVRSYILQEKVVRNFQWGVKLGLGYGFLSGDIAQKLDNSLNGLIGFEFFYRNWRLNLNIQSLNSRALTTIVGKDLTLNAGQDANYFDFHFNIGYNLLKIKNMSLAPYLGLGFSRLTHEKANKDQDLPIIYDLTPTLNTGVQYDYYFGEIFPNRYARWNYSAWLWGINARYHMTSLTGFETKGLLHGLTIGLSLKSNYKRRIDF